MYNSQEVGCPFKGVIMPIVRKGSSTVEPEAKGFEASVERYGRTPLKTGMDIIFTPEDI